MATALVSVIEAAKRAEVDLQVVVVDNASPDESVTVVQRFFPAALIIANTTNRGFGRACNQAFERTSGEYCLLLNPDAEVDPDSLRALVSFLDAHPSAGAVGPRIVGGAQARSENAGMAPSLRALAGHFLFLNRLPAMASGPWRGYFVRPAQAGGPVLVDWCGAAVLLVRSAAIRVVNGFDTSFFLYGEDVDLGMRLTAAGWSVWLEPAATAHHGIAGSQGGLSTRWVDGTLQVVRRGGGRVRVAALIMAVGLAVRAVAAALRRSDPRLRHHSAVMGASAVRALRHVVGPARQS